MKKQELASIFLFLNRQAQNNSKTFKQHLKKTALNNMKRKQKQTNKVSKHAKILETIEEKKT